jgi:hypothetical protein
MLYPNEDEDKDAGFEYLYSYVEGLGLTYDSDQGGYYSDGVRVIFMNYK